MVKANIATLARRKSYSKVIQSIENGTDVNTVTLDGNNSLHFAVKSSILRNIKYLIEKGINVNLKNKDGVTPLMSACDCDRNDCEVVKFLITEGGANINEKNNEGNNALIYAYNRNKYDIAKLLIEHGANVTKPIKDTYNINIMKLLVEHGTKINSNALSQIMNNSWVLTKDFERIKFLVEHGANVNSKNKDGKPIFHFYMIKLIELKTYYKEEILDIEKYTNIIKYLISKGADIDLLSGRNKYYIFCPTRLDMIPEYFETITDDDLKQEAMKYYEEVMIEKSKERSSLLREELVAKYHSPENIEKWSVYMNKPFDEVIEVM